MTTPLIDIIVPVYRGLKDVQDCLNSLYASPQKTPYELIVIDDCSPEPAVSAYLKEEAEKGLFTLLINEENLGFVATVNRGMQQHLDRDVLLLNSDTIVANDWLDRIYQSAYRQEQVGTVTPFSNNATICSYPKFCEDNALPSHTSLAHLDSLFAQVNSGQSVAIPTGVGFCMYIRRQCLEEVGYFDVETFGKGYGEENDFCQRAIKAGWTNLFALDVFVQHTGNVSFGDEHNELKHGALGKLVKHHPNYERDVHIHIAEDPAKQARSSVWLASLLTSEQPLVIHVSHNRGGGTLRFVEELSHEIAHQAHSLLLMPSKLKPGFMVLTEVRVSAEGLTPIESEYSLYFNSENQKKLLISTLKELPIAGFHFHHMVDLPDWVMSVPKQLNKQWAVTLHDFYFACESISLTDYNDKFVGQTTADVIVSSEAAFDDNSARQAWRSRFEPLLNGAVRCFTPSRDATSRLAHYFPKAHFTTQYHQQAAHFAAHYFPAPLPPKADETLNVVVIGALSRIKGADLLERVAVLCKQQNINVEFELIGYAYRDLITKPDSHLHVNGRYKESQLSHLLEARKQSHKADLVWFTALWPETFSYTLSSAIEAKLPIIAPSVGAFSERLYGRPESWIIPWNWEAERIATLFKDIATHGSQAPELTTLSSQIAPATQDFQYRSHYLSMFAPIAPTKVSAQSVQAWLDKARPLLNGKPTFKQRLRRSLLQPLIYLHGMPMLKPLVQCIPLTWRQRIKSKLSN